VLFIILSVLGVKITALLAPPGSWALRWVSPPDQHVQPDQRPVPDLGETLPDRDAIKVGENTGVILSIDLLSVKIKTFDNQYIRIPTRC